MEFITLGRTGLKISRMGFGGIPIQRIDAESTRSLIRQVADAGVNYIDTARGYTVSEEWLGGALEGIRDRFVLATKSMARTREAMEKDIAISLANLRTDHVELYQIHNPSPADMDTVFGPGGAMEALLAAKAAGKVGHIGLTAHSTEVFAAALEHEEIETIMFPYNIVETQGQDLIARAAEKGVGFIAMKPLAGGAIEDATLALRFILANSDVSVVIPGMADPAELAQNLAACEDRSPLSEEETAKMDAIRKELGTNFCRRCNYCAPCTVGISIPNVFLFAGYLNRYGLGDWARSRYAGLPHKAGDCVECGVCETRCPYQLPIRQMMRKAAQDFGE